MDTKQLKQKILDLAIRGKLVPQDPNDEPASVLLERIRKEKEQLIASGKLKKSKSKTTDTPHYENVPFEIPASWEWVRLEDYVSKVTDFVASGSFASLRENVTYYKEENYAILVRTADFGSNFNKDLVYTDKHGYEFLENSNLVGGELILPNIGASIGKVFIVPKLSKRMTLGPNSILIRTLEENMTIYLYYSFLSLWGYNLLHNISSATAQGKFNKTDLKKVILPIPPYFEQKRIIKAIKDWFSQIDNIDKDIADIQDAIKQTKLKVLDLAIHGKLVPQDPNDEPAIDLLKRINPSFKPCDTSHYENLPSGWCVAHMGEVYNHTTGKALKKADSAGELRQYITTSNVYWNCFDFTEVRSMYFTEKELDKCTVHKGDLLVCNGGDVGRAAIWDYDYDICYQNHISRLRLISVDIVFNPFYSYLFRYLKDKGQLNGKGVAITSLSATDIQSLAIPVPPLAEQKRIVKRIETIFAQLDTITAEL